MYQLFYQLAIIAGVAVMISEGRRRGLRTEHWLPVVLLWAIGGVIGASLPHFLVGDAVAARTAVGAVAGATLMLVAAAMLQKVDVGTALDTTALAIPIAGAFARLGCFAGECCDGVATSLPIGITGSDGIARHPTQLYEAAFDISLAAWLLRSRRRLADGQRFLISLGAMSIGRFAIEFVRDSDKIGPLSLAQWIVGPFALICLAAVAMGIRFPAARAGAPRRLATAGMTALALQLPAPTDSFPQRYSFWGVGFGHGGYSLDHENYNNCDVESTQKWSRFHKYYGGSIEGGFLRQGSEWSGFGYRGRASYSLDNADRAIATLGTAPNPERYSNTNMSAGGFADFTGKYAALTLGGTVGLMRPALAGTFVDDRDPVDAWAFYPGVAARLGPLFGPSIEFRFGDEVPLNVPLPMMSLGVAGGDKNGNRIRVGLSDGGYFAAATFKRPNGLELMPSAYILRTEHFGRQGVGLAVRQWTRLPNRK